MKCRALLPVSFSLWLLVAICAGAEPPAPAQPALVDQLLNTPAPAPQWTARDPNYVPPDDASIDELLDFWSVARSNMSADSKVGPTEIVRRKLLAAALENPKIFAEVLPFLPETPEAFDAVKALHDRPAGAGALDEEGNAAAQGWLMTRSRYFRAELIAVAEGKSTKEQEQIAEATAALAKLDWQAAEALLRKRAGGDDAMAARALIVLYRHAKEVADKETEKSFRQRLEQIAANPALPLDVREKAVEGLLAFSWEGQAEWISSLLGNPVFFHQAAPGGRLFSEGSANEKEDPFENVLKREPARFIPVLAKLAGDKNGIIRRVAAERLVKIPRADALRQLLPWIADPDWCQGKGRDDLLHALAKVEAAGSGPLLSALAPSSKGDDLATIAVALARQNTADAAAFLRKAVEEVGYLEYPRGGGGGGLFWDGTPYRDNIDVVQVAVERDVLTDEQIIAAILAYVQHRAEEAAAEEARGKGAFGFPSASSHEALLGGELVEISIPPLRGIQGRPGLTEKLLDRWAALRVDKPAVASQLWDVIAAWPDKAVDERLLSRLTETPLTEQAVTSAIARRALMREHVAKGLRDLARRGGESAGVAAGILGDVEVAKAILESHDRKAAVMLLAVARLGRIALPLASVGKLLESADAGLARAAERYLECEDSEKARQLVFARHPGEALILGAEAFGSFVDNAVAFAPSYSSEAPLRQEILGKNGPAEIIALLGGGMTGDVGECIIRIRGNAATLELRPWETPGKFVTRDVLPNELKKLKDFIAKENFDNLPQLMTNTVDGAFYTYLHMTRDGGRRITMHEPGTEGTAGSPHARFTSLIRRLSATGTFHLHYALETTVPGTAILVAGSDHRIGAVWMRGGELVVRVDENGALVWHAMRDGKLGQAVAPPVGFVSTDEVKLNAPADFYSGGTGPEDQWRLADGNSRIVVGRFAGVADDPERNFDLFYGWLYRCRQGKPPQQIGDLLVTAPMVTYDSRFVFATLRDGNHQGALVRVDAATGKALKIDLPADKEYFARAYVPIADKVLVYESEGHYWLVDPASGAAEAPSRSFDPLLHSNGRPAPSARHADEVWLATQDDPSNPAFFHPPMPDAFDGTRIGRFNVRNCVWTEVITLPAMRVFNDHLAVDEAGGVMYIAVNGDLLRVPIPAR